MVSYLAFDNRSIKELLDDKNSQFFSDKYPVFYKNEDGTSAIDAALDNNQIRSVKLMIDYIINYQNSFVYAHLFEYNLVELLQKQVELTGLFNSKVLTYTFDFDEWPATHPNRDGMKGPYNDSMFSLRYRYANVFKELFKKDTDRYLKQ